MTTETRATLTPYIAAYLKNRRTRGEINQRTALDVSFTLAGFSRTFGNRPLPQLGPAAIDRWLESIAHLEPSTRRNYLSRIRTFTDWMLHQGHIHKDPCAGIKPIVQPEPMPVTLRPSEVGQLLEFLPDSRARAVIMLEYGMGLRAGEVSRLTTRDWDQTAGTMLIRGKRMKERTLPVPDEVARALRAYLAEVGERPGPLIRSVTRPWAGLSPATLSHYVRFWMRDAGVKRGPNDGRSGHSFRRTAATELLDACGDVRVVSAFLGHSNTAVTMKHYIRRAELAQIRTAMEVRDLSPPAAA